MTPEEKSLLERTYSLVKENNDLLQSLKRRARFGTTMKVLYWVVILGISFGAFYFIQPYIDYVKDLSGKSDKSSILVPEYTKQIKELIN